MFIITIGDSHWNKGLRFINEDLAEIYILLFVKVYSVHRLQRSPHLINDQTQSGVRTKAEGPAYRVKLNSQLHLKSHRNKNLQNDKQDYILIPPAAHMHNYKIQMGNSKTFYNYASFRCKKFECLCETVIYV